MYNVIEKRKTGSCWNSRKEPAAASILVWGSSQSSPLLLPKSFNRTFFWSLGAPQRQCKRCVNFLLRIPDKGNQNRRFLVQQRMLKDRIIRRQTARGGRGGRGRRMRRRKGGGSSSGIFALPSEWGGGAVPRYFSFEKCRNNLLSFVNLGLVGKKMLNEDQLGQNYFHPKRVCCIFQAIGHLLVPRRP